ncbi:MAG: DUF6527 family protein [Longimicrobiaceae bacterium]
MIRWAAVRLAAAFRSVRAWLSQQPERRWELERGDELPDTPRDRIVYVVGEEGIDYYAAMRCPCGCGDILQLSLLPEGRPRWRVYEDRSGIASLSPSVNRTIGCRSHFYLRDGRIEWYR